MNNIPSSAHNNRRREVTDKMAPDALVEEKLWLHYFNQTLHQRGVISETERNKMALRIEGRKPCAPPKKP